MDKVAELIKQGRIKEINDMRDETDLNGLKLAIDLKRGVDPEKLMQKLFKMTPLMDSFSCNFNILIAGIPRVMGIAEILDEWTAWRIDCVRRRVYFELTKKKEKLHLLKGLKRILLDIDKAISIIRNTEVEAEVVPNLMIGFGIDELQAEFVADIKLRNINKEYILKRVEETETLEKDIADLEDLLQSRRRIKAVIIEELKNVMKKYGAPRRTGIVYADEVEHYSEEEHIEDYEVNIFLSREGYFKKITPLSLRMGGEQKYKENDSLLLSFEATNRDELLIFTDRQQCYKAKVSDFEDTKASALGTYLPSHLGMDAGENVVYMANARDYKGSLLFFFENGKAARVPVSAYETKANRRKLTGAYSDKSPLKAVIELTEDMEVAVYSTDGRAIIFNTALIAPKTTRTTQGVSIMALKARRKLKSARPLSATGIQNVSRYRVRNLPAAGALLREEDLEEKQMSLL
jgi:DNA gyrase subunit A